MLPTQVFPYEPGEASLQSKQSEVSCFNWPSFFLANIEIPVKYINKIILEYHQKSLRPRIPRNSKDHEAETLGLGVPINNETPL